MAGVFSSPMKALTFVCGVKISENFFTQNHEFKPILNLKNQIGLKNTELVLSAMTGVSGVTLSRLTPQFFPSLFGIIQMAPTSTVYHALALSLARQANPIEAQASQTYPMLRNVGSYFYGYGLATLITFPFVHIDLIKDRYRTAGYFSKDIGMSARDLAWHEAYYNPSTRDLFSRWIKKDGVPMTCFKTIRGAPKAALLVGLQMSTALTTADLICANLQNSGPAR